MRPNKGLRSLQILQMQRARPRRPVSKGVALAAAPVVTVSWYLDQRLLCRAIPKRYIVPPSIGPPPPARYRATGRSRVRGSHQDDVRRFDSTPLVQLGKRPV